MSKAHDHMVEEVASDGGVKQAGPYLVSYAVEEAEGMYHLENGELVWKEPESVQLRLKKDADSADFFTESVFICKNPFHPRPIHSSSSLSEKPIFPFYRTQICAD